MRKIKTNRLPLAIGLALAGVFVVGLYSCDQPGRVDPGEGDTVLTPLDTPMRLETDTMPPNDTTNGKGEQTPPPRPKSDTRSTSLP